MRFGRRLSVGAVALGLTFAPVLATAARVHAETSDAEGADGGDVSGGEGGAGAAGVLPSGNQNDALSGEHECFSDDGCDLSFDNEDASDWFATDAFALDG